MEKPAAASGSGAKNSSAVSAEQSAEKDKTVLETDQQNTSAGKPGDAGNAKKEKKKSGKSG